MQRRRRSTSMSSYATRISSGDGRSSPTAGTSRSIRRTSTPSSRPSSAMLAASIRELGESETRGEAPNAVGDQDGQGDADLRQRAIPEDEIIEAVHRPRRRGRERHLLEPRRLHEEWPPASSDGAHDHDDRQAEWNDLLASPGEGADEQAETRQAEDDRER